MSFRGIAALALAANPRALPTGEDVGPERGALQCGPPSSPHNQPHALLIRHDFQGLRAQPRGHVRHAAFITL